MLATDRRLAYIALMHAFVDAAMAGGCVDCGTKEQVVLDLDHVKGMKTSGVGNMMSELRPLSVLFAEIDKCETRCSNCHRRETARRRGASSLPWLRAPMFRRTRNPRVLTKDLPVSEVVAGYAGGESTYDLGRRFDVDNTVIYTVLKGAGAVLRSRKEAARIRRRRADGSFYSNR